MNWTKLAISGPAATAVLADQFPVPTLMRDGILFSSGSIATDWFGTGLP